MKFVEKNDFLAGPACYYDVAMETSEIVDTQLAYQMNERHE